MRSIAIIKKSTGAKVQATALSTESHSTGAGIKSIDDRGRRITNCPMQKPQATLVARPVRRSAPRRLTSSPL